MTAPLWKLDQVTLRGNLRPRLAAVSLEIKPGRTAVLGHSGAGKTSLLNLLAGFEQPDAGTLSPSPSSDPQRLPVFWSPPGNGLWPHLTVAQHLQTVIPENHLADRRVAELLAAFDFADKFGAYPDQLSQGECTRLAVARAIASGAQILVLDEPLVHVDPAASRRYWDRLRTLVGEPSSTSLVFSTHSPEVVLREAEQVICLAEGRAVYSGSVPELYYNPPTADLAWALGPANWVEADEQARWMTGGPSTRRCYRPEELDAEPAPNSPLVVQTSTFAGSIGELEIRDERSGECRRVYHRPTSSLLQAGQRVILHVLALVLLACFVSGCSQASAEPKLSVRHTQNWMLPAEGAKIPAPRAIHVGLHEELFVIDNAGRVLVYDLNGKLLRQWWMPDYSVGKPEKIFQFQSGRLGVADTHYHRVIFFDDQGTVLSMHGSLGHGPGEFIYPVAIVEDPEGNYYVGEYGENDRIQKFDKDGNFLLQIGSVGTGPGQFQRPSGMVWLDHKLYVVDAFNSRIQVFAETGEFLEVLAEGDAASALSYPYDIVANSQKELFVAEYSGGRISKFDIHGRLLGRHGSTGSHADQFFTPWGIAHDGKSVVFVADTGNRRVVAVEF
ncbi:MAG: ATP-binding cassette domain-containing protein [Planctomycetes bacterium]|nr:ATP-binding cassette domain-containing protein [Planctomycetota bacterium]